MQPSARRNTATCVPSGRYLGTQQLVHDAVDALVESEQPQVHVVSRRRLEDILTAVIEHEVELERVLLSNATPSARQPLSCKPTPARTIVRNARMSCSGITPSASPLPEELSDVMLPRRGREAQYTRRAPCGIVWQRQPGQVGIRDARTARAWRITYSQGEPLLLELSVLVQNLQQAFLSARPGSDTAKPAKHGVGQEGDSLRAHKRAAPTRTEWRCFGSGCRKSGAPRPTTGWASTCHCSAEM